jgi:urocanate hydratase
MTQENDRLRAALEADDEAFLNSLEKERGLFAQIGETFRGPMRTMTIAANVAVLIATAVGLWAVWKMFGAASTREMILWAGAAWAAWTLQIGIKQWIWSRVNTLSILREMKRMELRMAALEARLR